MHIGMNTEFKVKLTPKDDEAVNSQSLPMPIQSKGDLLVELALMLKHGSITALPFSSRHFPYLHRGSPTGNYVFFLISEKSKVWLSMTLPTKIIQLEPCQTQRSTWQGSLYTANWTALRPITNCKWRTNGQWKCFHSILPAELLPTQGFHRVPANLCLPFQVPCASTWTQLSKKLTNVLNTWTTSESQPKSLRTLQGTFGQFLSSFAKQDDWKWHSRNAILKSDKLIS